MILIREGSVEEIAELLQKLPEFENPYSIDVLTSQLGQSSLILIAEIDGEPVGFKCGYPDNQYVESTFYSWLGGVLEDFRRMGVAAALLEEMESRSVSMSFKWLVFKTLNEHSNMMIFALKSGFQIEEVVKSEKDYRKRIIFKKRLIS